LTAGLWSSDDNSYLIAWLLGIAEKGIMDMPFFPDIMTLIESKQLKVPEKYKERVAAAILQIKLDFGGQL